VIGFDSAECGMRKVGPQAANCRALRGICFSPDCLPGPSPRPRVQVSLCGPCASA